jgi:hypothetical protein
MTSPNTLLIFKSVPDTGRRYSPEVKTRVIQLALGGIPRREISSLTHVPIRAISDILKRARKRGVNIPDCRPISRKGVFIRIPLDVVQKLESGYSAKCSKVEVTALIARLLRVISEEPTLIHAILDEEE